MSGLDKPMKVLFFAQARQIAGCEHYWLKVDEALSESDFWALLIKAFPGLASFRQTARLARNETYLGKGEVLNPGDEIAVIPPVSGG
jgi:molybdopterin synthase catalytic subunit/molybdopterin synthase sulfur carrier subunit